MSLSKFIRLCLILSMLSLAACGDSAGTFKIGTSKQEQAYRDLGQALQTELQRRGQLQLRTVETKGSLENLKRLRSGELDFAFVQGGFGIDGEGLRLVAAVDTEYLHIVVPVSSEIKDLSDLAGKRIAGGIAGTGSRLLLERLVEKASFVPPIQLIPTTRETILKQLTVGEVDAAIFVTDLLRELEPLFAGNQFRLAGVRAAEALSRLLFDVEAAVIPSGVYGSNFSIPPTATPSLAVKTNLLVRADVSNRTVTQVIEALFDYRVRRDAQLPDLTEETGRADATLTIHPAAEDYYTRNDPITADQFEIAAFFLALFIAILSAVRFFWVYYKNLPLKGESSPPDPPSR